MSGMRALTVIPGKPNSQDVVDMPEPDESLGDVLVNGLALGICGTDREIIAGQYGEAPPGGERLILGHESLGEVAQAPQGSGFEAGDLIVGIVRMPDPVPCGACAHGEWDMCRNGRYTEHGIKGLQGFGAQQWRVRSDHAVRLNPGLREVGMLMEPTTVVAKAWEEVDRIGARAWFEPKSVLVTGAGPIGLLAAMIGAQRGLDVHVLDHNDSGPKPRLVRALGATYHSGDLARLLDRLQPDVVIEATGAVPVITALLTHSAPYQVTALTGVSETGQTEQLDVGAMNRGLVLDNGAVVGSVNANMRHYRAAADALHRADPDWLNGLISRRVPLERFAEALEHQAGDVKVVLTLS